MAGRISQMRSGAVLLAVSMLAMGLVVGIAAPAQAVCHWSVVRNHEPHGSTGTLQGVSALSSTDAWAVGSVQTPTRARPLAEHWDGTAWHEVKTPMDGRHIRLLRDVAAISHDDVWAVGTQISLGSGEVRSLTEHWDGASWTIVKPPNSHSDRDELMGVAAGSSDNVWAVGYKGLFQVPFVAHWNGAHWSQQLAPPGEALSGVAARFGNVWTVGTNPFADRHALLARRAGASWQTSDAPPRALLAITLRNTSDAWAVGFKPGKRPALLRPLILHWDGASWKSSPAPALHRSAELRAVAALSATKAWAVGTRNFRHPLMLKWNGQKWSVVFQPLVDGILNDVTTVPGSHALWAVGSSAPNPVILRYC
jgi:hypothetical protein